MVILTKRPITHRHVSNMLSQCPVSFCGMITLCSPVCQLPAGSSLQGSALDTCSQGQVETSLSVLPCASLCSAVLLQVCATACSSTPSHLFPQGKSIQGTGMSLAALGKGKAQYFQYSFLCWEGQRAAGGCLKCAVCPSRNEGIVGQLVHYFYVLLPFHVVFPGCFSFSLCAINDCLGL